MLERPSADNSDLVVALTISTDVRKRLLQGVEILDPLGADPVIDDLTTAASRYEGMTGSVVLAIFNECAQILRFGLRAHNADVQIERMQAEAFIKLAMCHSQREVFLLLRSYAASLVEHMLALVEKRERQTGARSAKVHPGELRKSDWTGKASASTWGSIRTYFSLVFKKETGEEFFGILDRRPCPRGQTTSPIRGKRSPTWRSRWVTAT